MNRTRAADRWRLARTGIALCAGVAILVAGTRLAGQSTRTGWTVVAWNNLGMHCMDADFSVFSILPPYNTIQAQVIDASGRLVTADAGVRVTYRAVADPSGSINTTSVGKTNFWSYVLPLFNVSLPADAGLVGRSMPGATNAAKPMAWDPALNWFIAEGIPITPYDDANKKNYYPLMRVAATDASGATLASTNIVLPVSDEMDCRACHASGSSAAARPTAGWVFDANAQRDYRFNILRAHDDRHLGSANYSSALAARGYSAAGLFATASGGRSILCASCHLSEALTGSGISGISPLTAAIHRLHAGASDPATGLTLDSSANRTACYRCHPGSETRCLRGAMGSAVSANGTMAIQCQNCHGSMSAVGASTRTGWLDEPTCQNCHTGTATQNSGAIRFTSVFDASGQARLAVNSTFATSDSAPVPGLYRFSAGHGGLQCSACHGATHAEYPSSHPNDNLQSVALQGHVGTIGECSACHTAGVPSTVTGGPHGMHPVGQAWVSQHDNAAESNRTRCQACHGVDYRGTVLSRSFAARTLTTEFGTKSLFRGAQVGCYMCHNGPSSESATANRPPVASSRTASTTAPLAIAIPLTATDPDGNTLTLRIVSQPANGTVGLAGTTATYYPFAGTSGTDSFTFAAWDGSIDSSLATVTVTVAAAPCTLTVAASVPATAAVGTAVPFGATPAPGANCAGEVSYDWNFGDGSSHSALQNAAHAYGTAGVFHWTLIAAVGSVTATAAGDISVGTSSPPPQPPPTITAIRQASNPFRLIVDGTNFLAGIRVYIGTDTTPWPSVTRSSGQRLTIGGSGLSSRFPRRQRVAIRVVNPDGQSATSSYTRR